MSPSQQLNAIADRVERDMTMSTAVMIRSDIRTVAYAVRAQEVTLAWTGRNHATKAAAAEMRLAAQQLAALIEAGEFDDLSPGMRCDLRALPLKFREWADAIDPDQAPDVPVESGTMLRFPVRGDAA